MNLVRYSKESDVSRLKELWKRCFGDEDSYIEHYFQTYYRPDRALVLESGGRAVSMLLTFPFSLSSECGALVNLCYVYAFCTDPAEQGKGYGRMLLREAEALAEQNGQSAVVMVPGEQSLFDFYGTLGYEPLFTNRQEEFTPGACGRCFPRSCSPQSYFQLRERWLFGIPHVTYPMEVLEYQLSLCRSSGGGYYEVGGGVACVELDDGILIVKELLSSEPADAVRSLMNLLGARRAEVRFPVLTGEQGQPFGVLKWLEEAPVQLHSGWLAFGFD